MHGIDVGTLEQPRFASYESGERRDVLRAPRSVPFGGRGRRIPHRMLPRRFVSEVAARRRRPARDAQDRSRSHRTLVLVLPPALHGARLRALEAPHSRDRGSVQQAMAVTLIPSWPFGPSRSRSGHEPRRDPLGRGGIGLDRRGSRAPKPIHVTVILAGTSHRRRRELPPARNLGRADDHGDRARARSALGPPRGGARPASAPRADFDARELRGAALAPFPAEIADALSEGAPTIADTPPDTVN